MEIIIKNYCTDKDDRIRFYVLSTCIFIFTISHFCSLIIKDAHYLLKNIFEKFFEEDYEKHFEFRLNFNAILHSVLNVLNCTDSDFNLDGLSYFQYYD